jgi:hypothetical protein
VVDDHGPAGLVDAPLDRAEDDGGCTFFNRQIAGDDATQMQGIVRTYDCIPHDGAVNVEIAVDHQRTFDLSLQGLHAKQTLCGKDAARLCDKSKIAIRIFLSAFDHGSI